MKRVLGVCSQCGGFVAMPESWRGIVPPLPTCDSCGATVRLPVLPTEGGRTPTRPPSRPAAVRGGRLQRALETPPVRRTRWMIEALRQSPYGCCDRNVDRNSCDCLAQALPDSADPPPCCSICSDPNCDNPGGKH